MRKSIHTVGRSLRRMKQLSSLGSMRSWWHSHDTRSSVNEKRALPAGDTDWSVESGVFAMRPQRALLDGKTKERAQIPALWLGLGV